jgi:crotonobetainyl-CoA:carnitine CoA-transferase CaiB-like acyl-CoA transferase
MAASDARPYDGLRVIEVAEDPAGELAGKLLADMGADVCKVEPPGGSPTRRIGPFAPPASCHEGPGASLTFRYYNTNKRGLVVDYRTPAGVTELRNLVAGTDVFVSTLAPAALRELGLDLDALRRDTPRLVIVSVTPFGLTGPRAEWRSSDLVAIAMGGPLNSCGYDDHDIAPIRPGENQSFHSVASFAHIGALLALLHRDQTGEGQLVDVAMHDCLAVGVELANPYWFYPGVLIHRQTCRHAQPTPTQPALFRCGDDRYVYFALILADPKPWRSLVDWMAEHDLAVDLVEPAYDDTAFRQSNFAHVQGLVECFFLLMSAEEVYRQGQARQLPIGIVNAPEEVLEDKHLAARGFFVDVEHPDGTTARYPGSPYRFSGWTAVPTRAAPVLGQAVDHAVE